MPSSGWLCIQLLLSLSPLPSCNSTKSGAMGQGFVTKDMTFLVSQLNQQTGSKITSQGSP